MKNQEISEEEYINRKGWWLSIDLTCAILNGIFIVYKLTVVTYNKDKSFNKLTLLPYKIMLAYAVLTMTQYCLSSPN